jgi:glycosyltransferase involved in cell wall biosynthesis
VSYEIAKVLATVRHDVAFDLGQRDRQQRSRLMSNPLVTVIMPLYNKAETIARAVDGVLAQSFGDFELLIVDDGSTDGSAQRLVSVFDRRIRLVSQANAGVSVARNRGIDEARSPWIALLDADDVWEPSHLEALLSVAGEDIVACFTNTRLESRRGGLLIGPNMPSGRIDDYFLFALTNGGYAIHTSCIMARREKMLEAGLFTPGATFGEDIDMWCRLSLLGPLAYVAIPTAYYYDLDSIRVGPDARHQPRVPPFVKRLPALLRDNAVPPHLTRGVNRYANFLMLEYARQLLDAGDLSNARRILVEQCDPCLDLGRYARRLLRTTDWGSRLAARWIMARNRTST